MSGNKNRRENGFDLKTWGFIAGAALMLALLTVVLCALGGAFDFTSGGAEESAAPIVTPAPPAASNTPMPTVPPDSTPRPTQEQQEVWIPISVIAGKGGSIAPAGLVQVVRGEDVTLTITPDEGYALDELKVDGETVEASGSYTFTNVTGEHSLYAVFRLLPAPEEPLPKPPAVTQTPTPASPTDIG